MRLLNLRLRGVSLMEMLLVLTGFAMLLVMLLNYSTQKAYDNRIERTAQQMQQVIIAAQAYYVKNNAWPASIAALQAAGFLPAIVTSPFGGTVYTVASSQTTFYVYTNIAATNAMRIANTIAAKLPLSYTSLDAATPPATPPASPCTAAAGDCKIVAVGNLPSQSINSAHAITFSGLVHHGGCVPVVPCPITGSNWTSQIMVAPVSVSGLNDPGTLNAYPVSSFTAYATGPAANPPACSGVSAQTPCVGTSAQYYRVCLQVITEKGNVATSNTDLWGQYVTVFALTRCTNTNDSEPGGSTFSTFTR